jgi:hypothetical protein
MRIASLRQGIVMNSALARTLLLTVGEVTIETVTEYWTYNFGPNRFMSMLAVVRGRVTNIATLGYGYEKKPLP